MIDLFFNNDTYNYYYYLDKLIIYDNILLLHNMSFILLFTSINYMYFNIKGNIFVIITFMGIVYMILDIVYILFSFINYGKIVLAYFIIIQLGKYYNIFNLYYILLQCNQL